MKPLRGPCHRVMFHWLWIYLLHFEYFMKTLDTLWVSDVRCDCLICFTFFCCLFFLCLLILHDINNFDIVSWIYNRSSSLRTLGESIVYWTPSIRNRGWNGSHDVVTNTISSRKFDIHNYVNNNHNRFEHKHLPGLQPLQLQLHSNYLVVWC